MILTDISIDFGLYILVFPFLLQFHSNSPFAPYSHWQSRENPSGDQDPDHWDHALLLTGLDLFAIGHDGFTTHQVVGNCKFHYVVHVTMILQKKKKKQQCKKRLEPLK